MTPGDPLKFCQYRICFIFTVMIYTTDVHIIRLFWQEACCLHPHQSPSANVGQVVQTRSMPWKAGRGWLKNSQQLRRKLFWQKRSKSHNLKAWPRQAKEAAPSQGSAVPAMEKLHSVPSCVYNQLLPPLCGTLPFTKSLLCLPWVPEGWTVCTEYQEATLHKNEQILSNLQRRRFTGDSTQQFVKWHMFKVHSLSWGTVFRANVKTVSLQCNCR